VIKLRGDSKEPPIKALQFSAGFILAELTPVQFQQMACSRQRLLDCRKIRAGGGMGGRERRRAVGVRRPLTGEAELAL
jgi:hypothetical protein